MMPSARKRTPKGTDSAYQSLRRLLLSSSANAEHLEAMDRSTLYGSIGFYLAAMALPNVTEFADVLATSPSLWVPPVRPDAAHVLVDRTTSLTQALVFAVQERLELITDNVGRRSPHAAPRELGLWVHAVLDGMHRAVERQSAGPWSLLPQLTLLTGLLQGLEAARVERRAKKDGRRALSFHLRRLVVTLQNEWAAVLAQLLPMLNDLNAAHAGSGTGFAALALAAQCIDILPASQLQLVDDRLWVTAVMPALLDVFGCASSTAHLDRLLTQATHCDGQVVLPPTDPALAWTHAAESHPLFPLAGPLTRLLAGAMHRLALTSTPAALEEMLGAEDTRLLATLYAIGAKLDTAWTTSAFGGAPSTAIAQESQAAVDGMWQVFKTYLFSVTMLLEAVVDAVVERSPALSETYPPARDAAPRHGWARMATSNTPAPYVRLLTDVLHIYLPLYFITTTFGLDGFESYRKVFYSALDVLSRDPDACTQLMAALANEVAPTRGAADQATFQQRIHATYVLLVAEQLVAEVPEAMVSELILPMCRPYLEDTQFQDAFESAHSVVLALYTAQSASTLELTPFYVGLLLRSFPSHLNEHQLTTALSTVVASLFNRSDSLAWWCVEEVDSATADALAAGDAARVRALTHALAMLISHVNLVLLRSLLAKVRAHILRLPEASAEREALVETTFGALGDMNAATREEAMRWWLHNAPAFTRGMPPTEAR